MDRSAGHPMGRFHQAGIARGRVEVRVDDLEDGWSGVGTLHSDVVGAHPDLGLTAEASFA